MRPAVADRPADGRLDLVVGQVLAGRPWAMAAQLLPGAGDDEQAVVDAER